MGAALTVVAGTGMSIWLVKRRQRGRASPRLEGAWQAVLWASPLLIALALPMRWMLGTEAPLVAFFWLGLALTIAVAAVSGDAARVRTWLASALGAVMAAIGAVHLIAMGGASQPIYIGFDLILLAGGAALLRLYARAALVRRAAELVPTPAE
jgi:hypothetical protein